MKNILIILFVLLFCLLTTMAQQNKNDIIEALVRYPPVDETIKVVTTKIGEGNPILDLLTPGHEIKKIRLRDSINKSDFDIRYYLEEYLNNQLKTEDMVLHSSDRSSYLCEIIINRVKDNRLSFIIQIPTWTTIRYMLPKENSNYKWKVFTETPFDKHVPVFLIYSEHKDDNTIEQKVEKLFASPSFKNLKDKDKMAQQIKTVLNHFYLFAYDVIKN